MHSMSFLHRSASRMIAGAFFAALFAIGIAPALAQPVFSIEKTGVLDSGDVVFTITATNTGDEVGDPFMEDILPLFPGSDWEIVTDDNMGCGSVNGAPGAQQSLECDPTLDPVTGTATVVVRSPAPIGSCEAVPNTAIIYLDDTRDVEADSATATVSTGGTDCRMTGGGSVFTAGKGSTRVTHGFQIRCDASDPRQNLEINWPGTGNGQNNFHLTSLTSAQCNDTGLDQTPPKSSGFDTFIGRGVGTCNGLPATIGFVFTDAGEPGTPDTAYYLIDGDDNACDLETGPTILTRGNHQAHQ